MSGGLGRGPGRPKKSEGIKGYWTELKKMAKGKKLTRAEMAKRLTVSEATVDRDLEILRKQGRRSRRGKSK